MGEISSISWRPCFSTNHHSLNNHGTGLPKEHFCQAVMFMNHDGLAAMFMNQDGLNNLARGSSKQQFCQVIPKSVQGFLTRL